jgi:hypothetical protein
MCAEGDGMYQGILLIMLKKFDKNCRNISVFSYHSVFTQSNHFYFFSIIRNMIPYFAAPIPGPCQVVSGWGEGSIEKFGPPPIPGPPFPGGGGVVVGGGSRRSVPESKTFRSRKQNVPKNFVKP